MNAICTCGTTSGHYKCMCNTGYYGSGLIKECHCEYEKRNKLENENKKRIKKN